MRTPSARDHEEQVLVRRVVTALAGIALLTVVVVDLGLGADESWITASRLIVLGVAFGLLGRTRLRTSEVVTGAAMLLWAVALVSIGNTVSGTVAGTSEGAGLGSGVLWLAAGIAPAIFLAVPLRRGLLYCLGALLGFVGMVLVAAGGDGATIVDHPGVPQVFLSTLLVIGTAAAVAWLAGRSADERQRALRMWEERAAVAARLDAARRRRAALFSRTAEALRAPMDEVAAAVEPLRGSAPVDPSDAAVRTTLERVGQLSGTLLDAVVAHMDDLVARIRTDVADHDDGTPTAAAPLRGAESGADAVATVVMTFAVLAVVGIDAWRLWLLPTAGIEDPHALFGAANRMVVVLFLAAAVLAVRFPGPFGWTTTSLVMFAHPVAVLRVADDADRMTLLSAMAPAWRIAFLASGMLAVLAVIIERRVRDRDAFAAEASGDEERMAELRRQEQAADLSYAEAAHELKNPLSVILGAARTLEDHGSVLHPAQVDALRTALVHGVDRLGARLAVMRETASGEEALLPTNRSTHRPVAAADVLLDALAAARVALGDRAVDVDVRVTGEWTSAAPADVEHVLENLLTNAHKYGDQHGAVRLVARRAGRDVEVEVANRGGGLDPEDAERIFEPYWRAANADGEVAGTGIGLAVVTRLVAGWGGRCWVGVTGGWTTVGFTMPLAAPVQAPTWQELQDQLD